MTDSAVVVSSHRWIQPEDVLHKLSHTLLLLWLKQQQHIADQDATDLIAPIVCNQGEQTSEMGGRCGLVKLPLGDFSHALSERRRTLNVLLTSCAALLALS